VITTTQLPCDESVLTGRDVSHEQLIVIHERIDDGRSALHLWESLGTERVMGFLSSLVSGPEY
jgi:hypothetical protein